jgi:hypothetical protein
LGGNQAIAAPGVVDTFAMQVLTCRFTVIKPNGAEEIGFHLIRDGANNSFLQELYEEKGSVKRSSAEARWSYSAVGDSAKLTRGEMLIAFSTKMQFDANLEGNFRAVIGRH